MGRRYDIIFAAYKAGFYGDFHGTLEYYQTLNFIDYINRTGIGNQSLYQLTQLLLYALISIFGYHPIPWFILFTGLHTLNGYLIFKFFNSFFKKMNWSRSQNVAFTGSVLFLISPMACEVVVWKASFHYLIAVCIIFLILNWTIAYLNEQSKKYLWLIGIFYFCSSYMLELFYLTPVFIVLLLCCLLVSKKINAILFKSAVLRIFIPVSLIWCAHLLVYHWVYGKWVAHYNFNLSLSFVPVHIISQLGKYIIHIFCFESFLPFAYRQKIVHLTEMPLIEVTGGVILLGSLIAGFIKFRSMNARARSIFFLWLLSLISCILIIPMWFNNVNMIANDRYYYFPSVFFFMLAASIVLYGMKKKKLRYFIIGIYAVGCLVATFSIIRMYRKATKIQNDLMENFKWQNVDTVILLSLPNNYNGICLYPSDTIDYFNPYLKVFGYDTIKGKVYDVSSYNMQNEWDGVHVLVKDSLHLVVTPNQYGCWWWSRTLGATDYENDLYNFTLRDNAFSYLLKFKHTLGKGTVILYQQGGQWRKVDLSKTGEEQW